MLLQPKAKKRSQFPNFGKRKKACCSNNFKFEAHVVCCHTYLRKMHRSLLSSLFLRKDHWTSISSIRAERIITGIRLTRRRKWLKSRRRTFFAPIQWNPELGRQFQSNFQGNFPSVLTFLLPHSKKVWEDFTWRRFLTFSFSSPLLLIFFLPEAIFQLWLQVTKNPLFDLVWRRGENSKSPLIFCRKKAFDR